MSSGYLKTTIPCTEALLSSIQAYNVQLYGYVYILHTLCDPCFADDFVHYVYVAKPSLISLSCNLTIDERSQLATLQIWM